MQARLAAALEIVGLLLLLAAGLTIGGGLLVAVSGIGATGLGALTLPAGLIIAAAGAVGILPGRALRRAARTLGEMSELPATSARGRRVSTAVAAAAATAGAAPILTWIATTGSPNLFLVGQLLLGGAACLGAWSARYLLDRGLGAALIFFAMFVIGIGAWEATAVARDHAYAQELVGERERLEELYAPIKNGPTAGDVAALIPSAGSWRAVTGWVHPEPLGGDDYPYGPKDTLAAFRGQQVRLAVVGQCWVDGTDGSLAVTIFLPPRSAPTGSTSNRQQLEMPPIACDGEVHAVSSDAVRLPDGLDAGAPFVERQEWLTAIGSASPAVPVPGNPYADHAERWLVYVAADPGSSLDELRAALAAHLPKLVLTPPA
jgi:hypothetical protein